MRKLHELYALVLVDLQRTEKFFFICWVLDEFLDGKIITDDEFLLIMSHFNENKPNEKQHVMFTKNKSWNGGLAWWDGYEFIQREKFINKMIRITKKKNI